MSNFFNMGSISHDNNSNQKSEENKRNKNKLQENSK